MNSELFAQELTIGVVLRIYIVYIGSYWCGVWYIKLAHIYINGGGVETRCEGSDIYETRIILAVYIQGPAAGFSTSPC